MRIPCTASVLELVLLLMVADCSSGTSSPPPCDFQPSKYDNSCTDDSECVAVPEGDVCSIHCLRACSTGAINVRVASQYMKDIEAAAGEPSGAVCMCPNIMKPCCYRGVCGATPSACGESKANK